MARPVNMRLSGQQSNPMQSGMMGGTPGGRSTGARPGSRPILLGDELYLWVLVILEVMAIGFLRNHFRKRHGG